MTRAIILGLFLMLLSHNAFSQSLSNGTDKEDTITHADSLLYDGLSQINSAIPKVPRYKMYRTENIHILLELDTQEGRIEMVQYSTDGPKSRFKCSLSPYTPPGVNYYEPFYPGRFELYPTSNYYNYILLDTRTGDTWQAQWSTDRDQCMVLPIKSELDLYYEEQEAKENEKISQDNYRVIKEDAESRIETLKGQIQEARRDKDKEKVKSLSKELQEEKERLKDAKAHLPFGR